jgi:hypothetical protein
MPRSIVTLLTDFGTVDGFVGAMKGVILSRAPEAQLVDLTHEIPSQDVRAGAWALREAASMFPVGTIHVAVVDPGVGTARRPILVRSGGQLLVGPDNGLLGLAAPTGECWMLDRRELHRAEVSDTFHGRDIFASVAGHLAAGVRPEACGSSTSSFQRIEEPEARSVGGQLQGTVVHVDRFGNLVTNIRRELLADRRDPWQVEVGGHPVGPLRRTFADVAVGEPVAYIGSSGVLELAVRDGRADGLAVRGAEVRVW